jgi:glycosyltransferase involved in cell wall biosynthesis
MKKNIKLVIDTIAYFQKFGGITRMFNELIPRFFQIHPSIQLTFFQGKRIKQPLPLKSATRLIDVSWVDKLVRPWRIWHPSYPAIKAAIARLSLGGTKDKIWHSTYFTELDGWKGKQVVTVYDLAYPRFENFFTNKRSDEVRLQMKASIQHADRIICISKSTQRELLSFFPETPDHKLRVVYLGRSEKFRVIPPVKISYVNNISFPFILFVGKRKNYKNFKRVINAFSMWKNNSEICLVIVGPDWSAEELNDYNTKNWFKNIHHFGQVSDEFLVQLYNQASAFVWPSFYEGFGLPLLEAMSCRCPIVAARIPVNFEIAGEIPFYFDPDSTDELISMFDQVINVKRTDSRLAEGEKRAHQFSWDKAAHQMLQIYSELT